MKLEPRQESIELVCIDEGDRARKNYKNMEDLQASIVNEGLINPIAVMQTGDSKYLLLAGGRRYRAVIALKWEYVPCHVYPFIEDERMRRTIELKENIVREDLDYAEEAFLTREIHQLQIEINGEAIQGASGGHTLQDTADLLRKSRRAVTREIELADALDKNPELANFKTKSDAIKALAAEKEKVLITELAKRAMAKATSAGDRAKQQLIERYIVADTVETMKKMPDSVYNLVEIDPPYGIPMRNLVLMKHAGQADLLGGEDQMTKEEEEVFRLWIQDIFNEAYRVMKPDGWLLCWLALDPWLWSFHEMLSNAGFVGTRVPALWIKNSGNTRTPNIHLQNRFEPCLYMRKGQAVIARQGMGNTLVFPTPPHKVHPTEKPVEMYMDLLTTFAFPGAAVLSAFAGSGNILLAAANINMTAVGIDSDKSNKDQFSARVLRTDIGKYTSY